MVEGHADVCTWLIDFGAEVTDETDYGTPIWTQPIKVFVHVFSDD
jgi:hypothetical protein